jgi:phenylpropionate dioxygenase-like ring-hydroxylating dioxygenase large terminal subunit
MTYLRNAWYAAGWAGDLSDAPLPRTIHDQPIVLFRGENGNVSALYDACPHRFAPLSRGKVSAGRIACGYHGLEFDGGGRCVRNPHGKGIIPAALGVRSYPVVERYGMIWVWMGEQDKAEPGLIPLLPALDDPELSWVHGQLHVDANYELVVDNLLDLTHVEFMHPFLAAPGNAARTEFRAEQTGELVSAYYDIKGEPISGLFQLLWEGPETQGDMRAYMHWQAPSNLYLDTGMSPAGGDTSQGAKIPSVHLLTPETEDTTHYFWAAGRNCRHGDEQISGMLHFGTQNAFENEDEPMIRAVRSRMRSNDLFAHKPALLPIDEAAVRARRTLKKLIEAEQANAQLAA